MAKAVQEAKGRGEDVALYDDARMTRLVFDIEAALFEFVGAWVCALGKNGCSVHKACFARGVLSVHQPCYSCVPCSGKVVDKGYKDKARSVLFNLNDSSNPDLRRAVLTVCLQGCAHAAMYLKTSIPLHLSSSFVCSFVCKNVIHDATDFFLPILNWHPFNQ